MKKLITYFAAAVAVCLSLTACENALSEQEETQQDDLVNLKFNITQFEQMPFEDAMSASRGTTGAHEVCNRINFAIFNGEEKMKAINQTLSDEAFGTISATVPGGKYSVVILAHSGSGNATFSTPEEVKFQNNKVTDTFFYYGTIDTNEASSYDIKLKRAVAKFLLVTDNVPDNVAMMTFKYTGGSSTFNAVTGFGCVNSRQTETREVTADMKGKPGEFEVYTFPHNTSGELKMTVTATDASSETIVERIFENVPVTVNQITRYEGEFFKSSGESSASSFSLTTDDEWTEKKYNY